MYCFNDGQTHSQYNLAAESYAHNELQLKVRTIKNKSVIFKIHTTTLFRK